MRWNCMNKKLNGGLEEEILQLVFFLY
jgi:hypothetical protein